MIPEIEISEMLILVLWMEEVNEVLLRLDMIHATEIPEITVLITAEMDEELVRLCMIHAIEVQGIPETDIIGM